MLAISVSDDEKLPKELKYLNAKEVQLHVNIKLNLSIIKRWTKLEMLSINFKNPDRNYRLIKKLIKCADSKKLFLQNSNLEPVEIEKLNQIARGKMVVQFL